LLRLATKIEKENELEEIPHEFPTRVLLANELYILLWFVFTRFEAH